MAGPGASTVSAAVVGGFLCIGLFLLAIAAAIILSLIPTFTSTHTLQPAGEGNSIYTKFIKSLLN